MNVLKIQFMHSIYTFNNKSNNDVYLKKNSITTLMIDCHK